MTKAQWFLVIWGAFWCGYSLHLLWGRKRARKLFNEMLRNPLLVERLKRANGVPPYPSRF
jgi:hypothetical protein